MTSSDEIITIANKLANQGKKPTVALIKAQLSQPTPLPKIISILKTWQHDPTFTVLKDITKGETAKESFNDMNTDNLSLMIDKALQPLKEELKEIKELLKYQKKS